MTRLDPNPPAAAGRDIGFAAIEAALSTLAEPAPARLGHATLVAVGLADDYAVIDSPIGPLRVAWNGRGVSAVEGAPDDARVRGAASSPGPGAPRDARRRRCRPTSPGRSSAASPATASNRIDLDLRGTTEFEQAVWMKALEIPRGEVRPYGWIAAEIGRPKAVRAVGTALGHNPVPLIVPCHRVVRSDGMIGQYSLGGPAQQADDPRRARAPTRTSSRRWRGPAIRYFGSDTTHIYCLPTCHDARRVTERHLVAFPSARRGVGRRATGRAATAGRPRSRAPPEPRPARAPRARSRATRRATSLHSANLGPADYANGRAHDAPRRAPSWSGRAILILYVVWGSTYLGIRVAVESIPPFVMAATRFALAGLVMLGRGRDRPPRRARPAHRSVELRDSFIVGALLMGGGMGAGGLGRADRAVGDRRRS